MVGSVMYSDVPKSASLTVALALLELKSKFSLPKTCG